MPALRNGALGLVAFSCTSAVALQPLGPVPVYEAASYTSVVATHPHGVLQHVAAPDAQVLPVLHLFGNATERGEAFGELMAEEIGNFITKVFDDYLIALLKNVKLGTLPKWLQAAIHASSGFVGKKLAPVLQDALGFVSSRQDRFVHEAHDNTTQIFDEIAGIARGVCKKLGTERCNKELGGETAFGQRLLRTNYLPELIRMACSMAGATRSATAHGKLVQLRTLDFGSVPFANHGLLVVHHPSGGSPVVGKPAAFAMVSFPGFVGAVTGLNSAGLVESEKMDYDAKSVGYNTTCIKPFGVDLYSCIPGTYDGEAIPFLIRRILETAPNRHAAEDIIMNAHRTWHVYLGFGDSQTMDFDVVGYSHKEVKVWTNDNISELTSAPPIKDVTFIDMRVQPSKNLDLHNILDSMHGNITGHLMASVVPHTTGSADVHAMVVDHGEGKLYISMGTTVQDGTSYVRRACDAPMISFALDSLWTVPQPMSAQLIV